MIGAVPGALAAGHGALATCITSSTGRLFCTSTSGLGAAFAVFLIIELAVLLVTILAAVQIVTKAGYSGWWVLTIIVPILNIVMFLVFAFSDWPVRQEVKRLRSPPRFLGGGGYAASAGSWGGPGPWGGDPGAGHRPPSTPPAAGPPGSHGFPPESPASSNPPAAEASIPPFFQGSTPPVSTDSEQDGGVEPPSSAGGPSPGSPGQSAPSAQPGSAPPGWYPTPDGRRRYWDGAAWTDYFA